MARTVRSKRWMVTIHNPGFPTAELPTNDPDLRYAIWQLENCPTTGRPHIQLYAEFHNTITRVRLLRLWPGAHAEKANGNRNDCKAYCSKTATRDDNDDSGPHEFGDWSAGGQGARTDIQEAVETLKQGGMKRLLNECPVAFIKYPNGFRQLAEHLENANKPSDAAFEPRPWQKKVLDLLVPEPDDRTIIWVTDVQGNRGKSRLARHLVLEHGAVLLAGRVVDMMYLYNKERIVIFDITRAAADCTNHLYSMAEFLKNGMFTSTKYQPVQKIFAPPHVVFFANFSWDREKWSNDRVKEIDLDQVDRPQPTDFREALRMARVFM